MATANIKRILKRIDSGIEDFVKDLPDSEKKIYDKVMSIVKQLELDALGNVSNNVNNLKLVTTLNKEINNIVLNNDYLKKVSQFTGIYDDISNLNNQYLSTTFDKFKPSKVLPKIKDASIDITIDQLTEHGVAEQLSNEIKTLLSDNIKSGSSYTDMIDKLNVSIKGNDKVDGGLTRYSKQIATDSIHQYNATYTKQISSDLGSEFFVYSGSNIETTRPFCDHLTAKDDGYFHISEVKGFLKGIVGDKTVELDKKSKLPSGFYGNTTEENFFVLRGGYNCGHQIFPVSESSVPKSLLDRIKGKQITTNEQVIDVNEKKIKSEDEKELVLRENNKDIKFTKFPYDEVGFVYTDDFGKFIDDNAGIKVNQEQKDSLKDYQGVGYYDVNDTLRGLNQLKNPTPGQQIKINAIKKSIDDLDALLNKNEIKSDVILYRGYTSKIEVDLSKAKMMIGTTLNDKGYKSTSLSYRTSEFFLRRNADDTSIKTFFMLKILCKKGTKGVYCDLINDIGEKEVLLPRTSNLKVIDAQEGTFKASYKEIKKMIILTCEII